MDARDLTDGGAQLRGGSMVCIITVWTQAKGVMATFESQGSGNLSRYPSSQHIRICIRVHTVPCGLIFLLRASTEFYVFEDIHLHMQRFRVHDERTTRTRTSAIVHVCTHMHVFKQAVKFLSFHTWFYET